MAMTEERLAPSSYASDEEPDIAAYGGPKIGVIDSCATYCEQL